ncbi:F-box protein At1g11270-like [Neltuma alba]|uniref:F-box protein At1g11270-like n=1 Tax=Neltuma alba TaxID=207710 RepID=UPI0010A339B8|nr:F-box protein At1g11270-like [Prosopis alba]
MVNILKRLPVKSLLRLRCVCKGWNDLFKTQLFIKQHLHHSIHHRGPSLLLQWRHDTYDLQFGLLEYSDKKTLIPLNAPSIHVIPFVQVGIIGSSYGLVCLLEVEIDSLMKTQ